MSLITIRFKKAGSSVWLKRTFDPDGTPTGKLRLSILKPNGAVLIKNQMMNRLLQPIFPDIPFDDLLPFIQYPTGHFEEEVYYEVVTEEDGSTTYINKVRNVFVPDITQEEHDANYLQFKNALIENLKIAKEIYFPVIPDGPEYTWELVDLTKPYRERYTPIPVEVGKYTGNKWIITEEHNELYDYYTQISGYTTAPLLYLVNHIVKVS